MRRSKTVIIELEGRDKGKCFQLTEMSAANAEDWAARVFLALGHAAIDVPPDLMTSGMAGIYQMAHLVGRIQFPELKPLMDELMSCVQIVDDPKKPFPRTVDDQDIEEVSTRQYLRREVVDLHTNFFLGAVVLNLIAVASEMDTLNFSDTLTSPTPSAPSSAAV